MLVNGQYDQYWSEKNGSALSQPFKDLIQKLFSYEGDQRPTIEEIRQSDWMQ